MASLSLFGDGSRPAPVWQKVWLASLIVVTALATGVFACIAPLAAVAALCAVTLGRRDALVGAALVWLGNQAVGYGIAGYPIDADSMSWGVAMGLATLAATFLAAEIADRLRGQGGAIRLVVAFVAAFAAYEVLLAGVALVLGGLETFAPGIVAYLAGINAVWALGFALGYVLLAEIAGRRNDMARTAA